MDYSKWNINQDSLFYELNELNPNGIIEELGVERLNFMYSVLYGAKEIPKSIINKTTKEVAQLINELYMDRWERVKKIYEFESESVIGFESETTVDEQYIDVTNKNITNNQLNKTSAFNVDDMVESNGSDDEIIESGDKDSTKTYTQKKVSMQSVDIQRKMLENDSISKLICHDISRIIGLSVY